MFRCDLARRSVLLLLRNSSTAAVSRRPPADKKSSWLRNKLSIYGELSKFRLSSLVVVTTGAGFIAAGAPIDWAMLVSACFGTALCAASAGTFNQVLEKERDANMKRTSNRPLPSNKVTVKEATVFGTVTGVAGTSLLLAATNPVVAALGAANIFLYSIPYTLTKPRYELNTWIGSLVGAIPPVMGFAAATGGSLLAPAPLALGSLLFLWQFPHFFALSWMHRQDYARGNFAMVACNDPQGYRTAGLIWEYSLYLSALPLLTSAAGWTSWMFCVEGTAANLYLLYLARKFHQDRSNANARKIFLNSLWYLPLLLAGYVLHSAEWNQLAEEEKKLKDPSIDEFSDLLLQAKDKLKGVCIHELLAQGKLFPSNTANSSSDDVGAMETSEDSRKHGSLCLKIKTEQAIEVATENTLTSMELAAKGVQSISTVSSHSNVSSDGS